MLRLHYVPCHQPSYCYVCITFRVTTSVIATFALRNLSPHQLLVRLHYVPCNHTSYWYVCISFPFQHTTYCYVCITFPVTTQVTATYALRSLSPHKLLLRIHYVICHNITYCYVCITFRVKTSVIATYALRNLSTHSYWYVRITLRVDTQVILTYAFRSHFTTPVISTNALLSPSPHKLILLMHYVHCHHTSFCYVCNSFPVTTPVISTYALVSVSPHQLFLRMHYVPCHHTCLTLSEQLTVLQALK